MTAKDISRNILPDTATLRDAMERLNSGVGGIVLFVDTTQRLTSIATDGDLRRAILSGTSLNDTAQEFAQTDFTVGHADDDRTVNLARMSATIRHLPIVDRNGKPTDLLAWAELWRMPLVQPSLAGNEMRYVTDCLSSGWVSSQGSYISKFETAFTDYMGDGLARCTSSGTTALHLALLGLEIGPGDEVIVPNLTFGATANAVVHAGAAPVFVDVDQETWTINPDEVAKAVTKNTKAVIPVHLYGHPCDMDRLIEIAVSHDLRIIEDCAESLGATYKGRKTGTFGDVACFSFFANKVITTGEGGMIWCRDNEVFERIGVYRDHGMSKEKRYWHTVTGYNYRMTNMQAAIGLAQIEQIDRFLERRGALADRYRRHLSGISGLRLPPHADWADPICWLYTILLDTRDIGLDMAALVARLSERGIETRNVFHPLANQPAFNSYRSLPTPVTDDVASRGLSLPTSNDMSEEDVDVVCDALLSVVNTSQAVAAAGA